MEQQVWRCPDEVGGEEGQMSDLSYLILDISHVNPPGLRNERGNDPG